MMVPSHHIFEKIIKDQSNKKLIENNLRGVFVEYLIVDILGLGWSVCDGSWNSWDIDGPNATRLEVKSSAYIQSWYNWSVSQGREGISVPRFDIAERKSFWDGESEVEFKGLGRAAHLYIFALHAEKDPEVADHRVPEQWNFYIVKSETLPVGQKSIGLSGIQKLSKPVSADNLLNEVNSKIDNWAYNK